MEDLRCFIYQMESRNIYTKNEKRISVVQHHQKFKRFNDISRHKSHSSFTMSSSLQSAVWGYSLLFFHRLMYTRSTNSIYTVCLTQECLMQGKLQMTVTAISPLCKLIWPLHVRIRGNWAESVSILLKNGAIVRSLGDTGTKMAPSLCWDFKLSNEGSFVEIGQEMTKLGWKVWKKSLQSLRAELQSLRAESIAVCMQRWSFRRRSLSWETSFDWSEMKVRALPGVSPHPAVRTWPGFQIKWTQPDFSWFFMRTIPAAENRGACFNLHVFLFFDKLWTALQSSLMLRHVLVLTGASVVLSCLFINVLCCVVTFQKLYVSYIKFECCMALSVCPPSWVLWGDKLTTMITGREKGKPW